MASFSTAAQNSFHNTHSHEGIGEDTPLLRGTRQSVHFNDSEEVQSEFHSSNQTFCEFLKGSKANFLYFFIALFVPPVLAIYIFIGDEEAFKNGYIIAGIFGIGSSLYGFNHFRLLFNLKHEVDEYNSKNAEFKTQRLLLDKQIHKLSSCNSILKDKRDSIHQSNLKMNNMIRELDAMEDRLRALGKSTKGNLTGIGRKTDKVKNRYYEIAICQQKTLLSKLFARLERDGINKNGLDVENYRTFCGLLPKEYQDRFERLGGYQAWCRISGQKKEFIDRQDFQKGLEIYARMHVENSDIAFTIERNRGFGNNGDREVKILKRVQRESFYLTNDEANDIWNDDVASQTPLDSENDREPGLLRKRPGHPSMS